MPAASDRSYRALLDVPSLGRILVSMQVARVAQSMFGVAIVLFALLEYESPGLAGLLTFVTIFPGLLVSPIAGALLDRHGRIRLIALDYVVSLVALVLIGGLALLDALPIPVLFLIATVASLTGILSHTGLRSLFPLVVPRPLWERANALDSNGYVVATILGPPIAAGLVGLVGGPATLIAVGIAFGLAAVALVGVPDPETETATSGGLLRDAWQGLRYTWSNRTLRGLGFSVSTANLAGGMTTIAVPLIVLDRLGFEEAAVGLVWAMSGVSGMLSAFLVGRVDTRGREWGLLVWPLVGMSLPAILLLAAAGSAPTLGLVLVGLSMAIGGLFTGPFDVALFTIRQRRTDPAWMGRAFAVSMGFNFIGYPIGAALAGSLATISLEAAIMVGVVACFAAAALTATMVPRTEPEAERTADPA